MNGPRFSKDFEVLDSSWTKFPSVSDPFAKFKYYSFHPNLDSNLKKTNRKTESLLDWMGDCGGLYDGLNLIVGSFLDFYQVYIFNS